MSGIYLLLPTLVTIFVSMLVVRGGAIALMMTGLHYDRAKFQALSAFSGTGFTTREAESVVNHPTRRRIVSWLMILGNAGIVAVIITATSSFVSTDVQAIPLSIVILAAGIAGIVFIATRTGLVARWEDFIERRLGRSSLFEEGLTDELLHFAEGYGLMRLRVRAGSVLAGHTIAESEIARLGIVVLGIERGREWVAAPKGRDVFAPGDRLVVYGRLEEIKGLETVPADVHAAPPHAG
jgi:hypothetical protein